jgi:hypothetical protein
MAELPNHEKVLFPLDHAADVAKQVFLQHARTQG